MLTRPQQILLKRAQREAAIPDAEYRDAVALFSGHANCRSSKDHRLGDRHLDLLMAYFEAIFWRRVDGGGGEVLPILRKNNAVFRRRGFWAAKNPRGNTSRERFAAGATEQKIAAAEEELLARGHIPGYLTAIRDRTGPRDRFYLAGLSRTLRAGS